MTHRSALGSSLTGAALLAAGLALGGCASVPRPEAQLSAADLALRDAEQADAAHYAPLEMRKARDQYDAARRAEEDEHYVTARRLAESAEVDAQLAASKARTARAQAAAEEITADLESLRSEARRAADRVR
jgi:hypothetical protein